MTGLLLALLSQAGCEDSGATSSPLHLAVVCDGTGSCCTACSVEALQRAFVAWAEPAVLRPGSSFVVVATGASYARTVALPPLVVPERWDGNARVARRRFVVDGLRVLATVAVPQDDPARPQLNQSNQVAALAVAMEQLQNLPGQKSLWLMSDGLLVVNRRFNGDKVLPTTADVLDYIGDARLTWTPAIFSSVRVCGFGNQGIDSVQAGRRRELWTGLLSGHGQPLHPEGSCEAAFPAVPAALQQDPDGGSPLAAKE